MTRLSVEPRSWVASLTRLITALDFELWTSRSTRSRSWSPAAYLDAPQTRQRTTTERSTTRTTEVDRPRPFRDELQILTIAWLDSPSAHASTIRQHVANTCDDFHRRAHRGQLARVRPRSA